jgi:hypothetical protein
MSTYSEISRMSDDELMRALVTDLYEGELIRFALACAWGV